MHDDHNACLPYTPDQQKPSKVGLHAIGGIIAHQPALTALTCSTVNSYRRLWDTGFWAPVFADWGFQNRTTGLRVSAPGRFEYRAVDSMVNPRSEEHTSELQSPCNLVCRRMMKKKKPNY